MPGMITVDSFRTFSAIDNEFTVIDPRPRERFVEGHPLAASNPIPER